MLNQNDDGDGCRHLILFADENTALQHKEETTQIFIWNIQIKKPCQKAHWLQGANKLLSNNIVNNDNTLTPNPNKTVSGKVTKFQEMALMSLT